MERIQALRGTRDILPDEVGYWQQVEAIARQRFARATYHEIRTPIFEQTELFARGIGEATDVVGKEMYTFTDRGDRSVTLRPEFTAGVVRAFIQNSKAFAGNVQRLWYGGPVFRYERPGAGRQRQFHQIGAELIGNGSPAADVEVIAIAMDILQQLGLKSLTLAINSLGTPPDRQRYREALVNYFTPYQKELDPDSQDRLTRNPLRILDSKDERTQAIVKDAPQLLDYLAEAAQAHFAQVQAMLKTLEIPFTVNPRLVRGLDYYTHTAFEIQSDDPDLGSQVAVGGGGRYDGLVEQLGGKPTPAVGWAMGIERLILLLAKLQAREPEPPAVYVVSRGDRATAQAMRIAQTLRDADINVEFDLTGANFKKQFKRADSSGAAVCLVVGEAEAEAGTMNVKWLASQVETPVAQADFFNTIETFKAQLTAAREQG